MSEEYLEHHGVLGQKWGVRRFQNTDGSLTAEGKRRVYAQGADGGYESRNNRYKRSIEGAKYEKDIARNQKKLDKAYAKGNEKKIAKYELADKILKKNKDIMLKDLSENEIKQGQDYIAIQKATLIGYIVGGPIGGVATGAAAMYSRKTQETQREINKEEASRRGKYDAENKIAYESASREKADQAANEYHKNGVYTYEYSTSDGKRHVDPIKDEKTARAILKDDAYKEQTKAMKEYNDKRNSFKTDEDKDLWERQQAATTQKERNAAINDRVKLAKKTGMYDMEFLEGNYDVDDATGDQLQGKALDDAYRKFLKENNSYGVNMHK